jgi:hypothetical protein
MTDSSLRPLDGSQVLEDPDRLAGRLIQKAHTRDGVPEIAVGLFFLLLAVLMQAQHLLEKEWQVFRAIPLVMVPIIFGAYLVRWAIKWIRVRYLVDRAGFVEFKPVSRKKRMQVALMGGIVAAVAVAAVGAAIQAHIHISSLSQWVLIGNGVFLGVLLPVAGRALRFVFMGALIAVTGILLGINNVGFEPGGPIFYGVAGAILAISGTGVLVRYLRQVSEAGD